MEKSEKLRFVCFSFKSVGSMICTSILRMMIPPLVHNDCNEEARVDVGSIDVSRVHTDCSEEARFDGICRFGLRHAASLSGFVFCSIFCLLLGFVTYYMWVCNSNIWSLLRWVRFKSAVTEVSSILISCH